MSLSALSLRLGVLACVLFLASLARADSEPAGYHQVIDEAVQEYRERHFQEAHALFVRAHEMYPNARTLRGIGISAFELRYYVECIQAGDEALRSKERPLTPSMRAEVESLLSRARTFIGRISIAVQPAATELWVDHALTPFPTPERPLLLEIGEHLIEVGAVDYAKERVALRVVGGEEKTVSFNLKRLTPDAPVGPVAGTRGTLPAEPANLPPPKVDSERRWYKSPWLWGAIGVVASGAVVGAVLATRDSSTSTDAAFEGNLGTVGGP